MNHPATLIEHNAAMKLNIPVTIHVWILHESNSQIVRKSEQF